MLLQPPVFFETEPLLSILKGLCVCEILGGSFSCDIASCGLRPGPWATSQTFTGKGFLSSRAKDHTQGPGWVRPVEMMMGIYRGLGGVFYYGSSWMRNAADRR